MNGWFIHGSRLVRTEWNYRSRRKRNVSSILKLKQKVDYEL